ncbi:phosphopantothenate--cysteine ligase 1 isoform X2 [Raphanus sativus]|uniref:Phosphopantothenate--cysteine ligase 1 isoform X2 n=1 Tax=Raphanus sativus TaxID=3726 RepID=A0A9W3D4N6_RAPSA|nr:phosphopantothenate--cysteine ligase 1 isoform X2 [Raphanus sativus]
MSSISVLGEDEVSSFFESSPPLKNMEEIVHKLNGFIQLNSTGGRRIVCVTSGGTTVPLEQRCVRYIDNFSSGNRGTSSRLDMLSYFSLGGELASHIAGLFLMIHSLSVSSFQITPTFEAVAEARLLKLPFTTIYEYLQMLRLIATAMKDVGPCSMFYLAAAVSDFYVPWKSMVEHKIESGSGPLDIRLAQVPKMLSILRTNWAPKAFCISFKLETDSKILIEKATKALQKYKVHAVVANELSTRKEEVVVVSSSGNVVVRCNSEKPESIVEDNLIRLIVDRHSTYIKEFGT